MFLGFLSPLMLLPFKCFIIRNKLHRQREKKAKKVVDTLMFGHFASNTTLLSFCLTLFHVNNLLPPLLHTHPPLHLMSVYCLPIKPLLTNNSYRSVCNLLPKHDIGDATGYPSS